MQGLHGPVLWGRPRGSLSRAAPGPYLQRHVHYVSQRPPAAASIPAATAWAVPYQVPAKALSISCHAAPGKAANSSSSSSSSSNSRGAKSVPERNRNTQQPRRQEQQQEAPQKRSRRQHSSTAVSAPSTQVSPKQLTVNIKQQTGMAGLQDLLQRNSSVVNAIHVTAALQWLVTHPREQPQSTEQLAVVVQQWMGWVEVGQLTACSCAHLAYYCSKLGYVEDLGLYRALLQRCLVVKEDAAPQAVSNLLYAFGSQEQLHGLLEQDVLVELLQQLQQMAALNAQDVANALWAAAKAAPQDSPALKVVVAQLLGTFVGSASDATPQNVSNTLYALALLPRAWPMDSALQLVEQLLQLLQRTHGAQSAANVLWAMGQYAERGWLSDLSDQSLAQVMAAATQLLGKVNGGPLQGSRSSAAKPQELANACWGVVKLQQLRVAPSSQRQPWQAPLERAVDAIVALLPQANSQDLSNTLWACGAVRYYPQQLLRAIASTPAPMPQVQQATPQEVGNMAWALAVLAPDPLPEALMASLLQRMQDLLTQQPAAVDAQNLSITAWAVAVMNQQQLAGQLAPLTAAAFSQQHWPGSHEEAKKQWHQVHLWLTDTQVVGAAGLGAFPGVSQQELEQCAAAWEEQLARDTTVSDVQKEVAKVLSRVPGVEVVGTEQRDQQDGSRRIDIVARYKGQLLAVEVDGPQHFTWPGQRPTGDTLARNRALERRGYRVVAVPVDPGWVQQRGLQQRQQYLQQLLDGQQPTSSAQPTTTTASSSSNAPATPTVLGSISQRAVAGTPGLLTRPQRARPAAAPGRPFKKKKSSKS